MKLNKFIPGNVAFLEFSTRCIGFAEFSQSHFLSSFGSYFSKIIVHGLMLKFRDYFKIFNSIIVFNTIFMVNKLMRIKISSQVSLHYYSMLKIVIIMVALRMIWSPLENISSFIMDYFKIFMRWSITRFISISTDTRAILRSIYLVWINFKVFITKQADFIWHHQQINVSRGGCQYGSTI